MEPVASVVVFRSGGGRAAAVLIAGIAVAAALWFGTEPATRWLPVDRPTDFAVDVQFTSGWGGGWQFEMTAGRATLDQRVAFAVSDADLDQLYLAYHLTTFRHDRCRVAWTDAGWLEVVGVAAGRRHRASIDPCAQSQWAIYAVIDRMIRQAPRAVITFTFAVASPKVSIDPEFNVGWYGAVAPGQTVPVTALAGLTNVIVTIGDLPRLVRIDTAATTAVSVHADGTLTIH